MLRFLIGCLSYFSTLGCLSYFSTDFKTAFAISSAKEFVLLYSGIYKFFVTFEKNEFSSSASFMSWVKILPSSTNVMSSFDLSLSEKRGLTVFQNFVLLERLFHLNLRNIVFCFFLKDLHNNCVA